MFVKFQLSISDRKLKFYKHLDRVKCTSVTVFEISHIYTRGRCAPETPLTKKILRGSQLYTRGWGSTPWNAPSGKIVISNNCT